MKRACVPAALHAELTSYTNLVRALRTTRTLDLTTHLINTAKNNDDLAWTLWPLIDCPVPEWTIADEIQHLAESVARHTVDSQPDSDSDSDSDLQNMPSTAANTLVFHTTALLVRILNLMADQRPSAPGSMQNRLRPMNWQDVISLLAVSRLLDPTIVARAEMRLEHVYGPSDTKAIHRLELVTAANTRFAKMADKHEDQLLAPPILHPRARRKDPIATRAHARRRSRQRRVKSRPIIDTDTDVDA